MEDGSREAVIWRNRALTLFDRVAVPVAVCDVYGDVLLANPAMAAECGTTPGRLRHRSRYEVSVRWEAPGGAERFGELTADPVSDTVEDTPALLVMLRVQGEREPHTDAPVHASPVEARILALLARGATTAKAAKETGLTTDGVAYHLRRLSARWGASNRTELVARAYALGVLASGVWPPGA
ncbi:helix-turn-helix transcriptional regulator [Streptomyces spinosirectus]